MKTSFKDAFVVKTIKRLDLLQDYLIKNNLHDYFVPLTLMRFDNTQKPNGYEFYFRFEDVITPEISELFNLLKIGIKKANLKKGEYFSK